MNFAFEWAVQHLVGDIQQHRCCLKFSDFMISLYQSVVSLGGSAASLSGAFGGQKSNDGPSAEWTSSDPWRYTGDLLIFVRRLYTHITYCNIYNIYIYLFFAVLSTKFECPTIQGSERPPMLAWMSWQSFVGSKSVWFYDRKLLITGDVYLLIWHSVAKGKPLRLDPSHHALVVLLVLDATLVSKLAQAWSKTF